MGLGAGLTIGWVSNASNRAISSLHSLPWTDATFNPKSAQAIIIRGRGDNEVGDIAVVASVIAPWTLKSQAARASHLEPSAMRCMERSHESGVAMGTPENCSHRSRIQMQRAYGSGKAARIALNLRSRDLENEDFLKKACGSIAIQNAVQVIGAHGVHPEGPKRSVLILRGSCPRSTRRLAAASTSEVGPQTKIFGARSGGKDASASSSLSILRRWPVHPSGCLRVSVCTTRKWGSPRAIASSSSRSITSPRLLDEYSSKAGLRTFRRAR